MITEVQITASQWAVISAQLSGQMEALQNSVVFQLWATLALFFIMGVCFYILFSGRGRK